MSEELHEDSLELDEQKANQEGGEELTEGEPHVQPAADETPEENRPAEGGDPATQNDTNDTGE